jgi:hypothetical protein
MSINLLEVIPRELLQILIIESVYDDVLLRPIFELFKAFPRLKPIVLSFILVENSKMHSHVLIISKNMKEDYVKVSEELIKCIIMKVSVAEDKTIYEKYLSLIENKYNIISLIRASFNNPNYKRYLVDILKNLYLLIFYPKLYNYYYDKLSDNIDIFTFFRMVVYPTNIGGILESVRKNEDNAIEILELYKVENYSMFKSIGVSKDAIEVLKMAGYEKLANYSLQIFNNVN